MRRDPKVLAGMLLAAGLFTLTLHDPVRAEECNSGSFSSTFELIQKAVFEKRGCTESICHGQSAGGGLDLRAERSYDSLIDQPATTPDPKRAWKRVVPGRRDQSLLFVNLAAKTLPGQYTAPLRAMPVDPIPALTLDELEAIRRWIEAGAPRDGVVAGTANLLDACLPPPEPIEIKPLDPPAPGTGVQLRMPITYLAPHSEHEQCMASYFDITDQVPPQFRGPNGDTFRYKRNEIRQDPLSHHLIVTLYNGAAPPNDPAWGPFSCRGGDKNGQSCQPTDLTFCGEGICSTTPRNSIACIGFGPQDADQGLANAGFTGTQETASEFDFPPGVYREVPTKGMIIWNTHAFNLTDKPGKVEAWLNFDFAAPEEQLIPAQQIFDARTIFKMNVPAFETQEVCSHFTLPRNAHLYELSSHAHQRMKRWRTYEGAFSCQGGPANGQACSPLGYDFASPDVCQGAPCQSLRRQPVCDCNVDDSVTVDEVVRSVNIALGSTPVDRCEDADANGDGEVTVDEILRGVNAALFGVPPRVARDPNESLLYVSMIYNDPIVLRFEPAMQFRTRSAEDRTLTYCALYDNGFVDPGTVKRRSTSPNPPAPIPGVGGPCTRPTHCTEGKPGAPCSGNNDRQRNASCDSTEGAGDGFCDACTLTGGVTTEDEMFILMGQYYVP
jgi:hypothetical protein